MTPIYRLAASENFREHLRLLASELHGPDLVRFTRALAYVNEQLTLRPLEWGEPHYNRKATGAVFCVGIRQPILIRYDVHEKARAVFPHSILLLDS